MRGRWLLRLQPRCGVRMLPPAAPAPQPFIFCCGSRLNLAWSTWGLQPPPSQAVAIVAGVQDRARAAPWVARKAGRGMGGTRGCRYTWEGEQIRGRGNMEAPGVDVRPFEPPVTWSQWERVVNSTRPLIIQFYLWKRNNCPSRTAPCTGLAKACPTSITSCTVIIVFTSSSTPAKLTIVKALKTYNCF